MGTIEASGICQDAKQRSDQPPFFTESGAANQTPWMTLKTLEL